MLLSELIEPEFVLLDTQASTWQDAVRVAAAPLVAKGRITSGYVEDIISAASELGPYFVLTQGVALPHGLPESGVLEPAMGICRLAQPVAFGSAANDPVRYVMVFGARDAVAHLDALTTLSDLIGDSAFFAAVDAATEPSQVLSYLRIHESSGKGS